MTLTGALHEERLCAELNVQRKVKECKMMIKNPSSQEERELRKDVAGTELWKVSNINEPVLCLQTDQFQRCCEDTREAYELFDPHQEAVIGLELLRSKLSSAAFYDAFDEAMADATKGVTLHAAWLVETFRNTPAGAQILGPQQSTHTSFHTPPHPSYDPSKHSKFHQVIVPRSEATLLSDEQFYFAFCRQLNTINLGQAGVFDVHIALHVNRLARDTRALVILDLIMTILTAKFQTS
jgi:hypothetical protein